MDVIAASFPSWWCQVQLYVWHVKCSHPIHNSNNMKHLSQSVTSADFLLTRNFVWWWNRRRDFDKTIRETRWWRKLRNFVELLVAIHWDRGDQLNWNHVIRKGDIYPMINCDRKDTRGNEFYFVLVNVVGNC